MQQIPTLDQHLCGKASLKKFQNFLTMFNKFQELFTDAHTQVKYNIMLRNKIKNRHTRTHAKT
uniref:Uncharacterized protein n=1 Tax=Rhizophora mucronata TaxID=61149 RepID=A0A2P2QAR0_RHIMU